MCVRYVYVCGCSGKGGVEALQHSHDVLALAYRPDGKLLASATLDGQIYLWDPQEAQLLVSCTTPSSSHCTWLGVAVSLQTYSLSKTQQAIGPCDRFAFQQGSLLAEAIPICKLHRCTVICTCFACGV